MDKNNKTKVIGGVIILLSIILIGSVVIRGFKEKDVENNTETNNIEQTTIETDEAEDSFLSTQDNYVALNDIEGALKYDVPEEINNLIDPAYFNGQLVEFLTSKNVLEKDAYEKSKTPIYTVTSNYYLTHDIKNDVYIFDLILDNKDKSIITVAVNKHNEYSFDII